MNTDLGYFALTPIWFRLLAVYLAVALCLAVYREKRAAGLGVAEAVAGVLLAAFVAPVLFVIELFKKPSA